MLRSRKSRREESLNDDVHVPQPLVSHADRLDPEHQALLADSVGLALLVVLEMLDPPERLAFVLHDMFAVPFDEIAPIVGRTPAAARQLASRARRRVQGAPTTPDTDIAQQRVVVDAFFAAARDGDFDALVAVLDPDVVLHSDGAGLARGAARELHGAEAVAGQALMFRARGRSVRPALVNGVAGVVAVVGGRAVSVMAFTVRGGRIVAMDALADPVRMRQLDVTFLDS
jgi:RNA polymerase sigma-70 factor (ECF subfamily)